MRLVRVHVENFGVLSGYDLELDPGLTVVREDNGFGKSTLAAFIRVMFYGMPRASGDLDKNDRKKFMPWQGGTFGGNLVFETEGRQYRIERTFGAAPKNDAFRLIDVAAGAESTRFGTNVGEELFGLDADSFMRSAYMPQGLPVANLSTDGIQAKIGGLVAEAGDMQNFDDAIKTLREKRSALVAYRGKSGSVWETSEKISSLRSEIDGMKERASHVPEIKERIAELDASACKDKEALESLDKKIAREDARQRQQRILRDNFESLKSEAKRNVLRTEEEIEDKKRAIRRKAELLERLKETARAYDDKKESREIKLTEENGQDTERRELSLQKAKAVIGIGIGLAVAGGSLYSHFREAYWLILAATGIVFIFAGIFKRNKILMKNEMARQKADEEKRYAELERRRAEDERRRTEEDIRNREDELGDFEGELRALLKRRDEAERRVHDIEKKEHEAFGGEAEPGEEQQKDLRRQRNELSDRLSAIQRESAKLEQQVETLEGLRIQIADKEDAVERLSGKMQEDSHTAELLDKTMEILSESKSAITERYIEPVRERFEFYAGKLTNLDGGEASIDTGLNLRIDRRGSLREIKYFSAGQSDALMICMRFALIDVMFPGEKPFIILDDPFINLDDTNTEKAVSLLHRMADERQVLYLVCNGSRC